MFFKWQKKSEKYVGNALKIKHNEHTVKDRIHLFLLLLKRDVYAAGCLAGMRKVAECCALQKCCTLGAINL